jgi:hypothetical protein
MSYRQLAAFGCATPAEPAAPGSLEPDRLETALGSVAAEVVLSVADVSSVVEVVVSVELVVGVTTEFAEPTLVPAGETVAVTGVAVVPCEVSQARANPGMARANAATSAMMAGTSQPLIRLRFSVVMAFGSLDEGTFTTSTQAAVHLQAVSAATGKA